MRKFNLIAIAALPAISGCTLHTHYALVDNYAQPFVDAGIRAAVWPFLLFGIASAITGGLVVWLAIKWQLRRRIALMLMPRESTTEANLTSVKIGVGYIDHASATPPDQIADSLSEENESVELVSLGQIEKR